MFHIIEICTFTNLCDMFYIFSFRYNLWIVVWIVWSKSHMLQRQFLHLSCTASRVSPYFHIILIWFYLCYHWKSNNTKYASKNQRIKWSTKKSCLLHVWSKSHMLFLFNFDPIFPASNIIGLIHDLLNVSLSVL